MRDGRQERGNERSRREQRILLRRELRAVLATIRKLEGELQRLGDREAPPWPSADQSLLGGAR